MMPHLFAVIYGVVFVGFALRGFTGFGAALAIVPLMALFMPLKQVVMVMAILSLVNGTWLALAAWRHVHWRELGALLVGGLPGTAIGVWVLHDWRPPLLQALLGGVVVFLGCLLILRSGIEARRTISPLAAPGAGWAAGVMGGLYGAMGPPLAFYLSGRALERNAVRATILLFFVVGDCLRLGAYEASGELSHRLWLTGLCLLPASTLGAAAGAFIHRRGDERLFRRVVGAVLTGLGLLLLFRSWPELFPARQSLAQPLCRLAASTLDGAPQC
jgi:uncharacterized membrane protein YfcA